MFHLRQLVFPVARQLRLGQVLDGQAAQQRHQLEGLGRGDQLAPFAQHVLLEDQAFDDGGARGRRAQALLGHGLAQLVVVDELARAFHRAQQRGLGVARRRPGLQRLHVHAVGAHRLALLHRHQVGVLVLGLLAVDGQPAGVDQHLAVGLEVVRGIGGLDLADARRHQVFGRRVEDGDEALDHQVVEFHLHLGQALGGLQRGDDGEVVRHLGVVEDALAGLDVAVVEALARVHRQLAQRARQVLVGQHAEGLLDHRQVVLGQVARVGPRVGQHLVLLVQRLRDRQRGLGAEAEAAVGLALQRRQVVQRRAALAAGLGLLGDGGRLAAAGAGDGLGAGGVPQAVGALLGVIGVLLPLGVEPLAFVQAGLRVETGAQFPVVARHVLADLLLALDHDRQRGRLHAAHGGEEEAAVAAVEGRHRARAVDAHQPVGLAAAARGVGQAQHLRVAAQLLEALADGLRRHALQPQALDGLGAGLVAEGVLHDQAEDQLALAPGVAGVDQRRDVLALDLPDHRRQARLGLVDRRQVEMRRHHRQVGKAPLAALDVVVVGRLDLHQVAHRRGDDVLVVLEMVRALLELAGHGRERAHDVLRHARLLRDDDGLSHALVSLSGHAGGRAYNASVSRARMHTRARP